MLSWLKNLLSQFGLGSDGAAAAVAPIAPKPRRRASDRRDPAREGLAREDGPERRSEPERRVGQRRQQGERRSAFAAPPIEEPKPAEEPALQPGDGAGEGEAEVEAPGEAESRPELPAVPEPTRGSGLEAESTINQSLRARQKAIVDRIGERVEKGKFELPHLPSTSMVVMDLAANPSSEINDIVSSLSTDPVLSTRILRLANSALYASREPVETLREAIMRVGMRELRSLIFALSMRQVIFRTKHLTSYAEETWRQSYSVGVIARAIGPLLGMPADKAFMIGLLHDVGKISLLAMMQREIEKPQDVTPSLVGRIFMQFHEAAGAAMARGWKLSDEFVSVAGCHHDYAANEEHGRSAALVSLAHRLDLNLSMGDESYWSAPNYHQLEFLGIAEDQQHEVLKAAYDAFLANGEDNNAGEAAAAA